MLKGTRSLAVRSLNRVVLAVLFGYLVAGCVRVVSLPSQMAAGVYTTSDGRQYMVVSPCYEQQIQTISLMYRPDDAVPGNKDDHVPVVVYKVSRDVSASDLFAPLDPTELTVPEGLELVSVDDELLKAALTATRHEGYGDSFYVEMTALTAEGSSDQLLGGWDSSEASPNSVWLGSEKYGRADTWVCSPDRIGWSVPPS